MAKVQREYDSKKGILQKAMEQADEELSKQQPDVRRIREILPMVGRGQEKFLKASENLKESKQKDDPPIEEIMELDEQESIFFGKSEALINMMKKFIKDSEKQEKEEDAEPTTASQDTGLRRLPKLDPPHFSGEPRDWLQFWSSFQTIHEDKIKDTTKFQYLIKAMEKGSVAADIISSYPVTAENYPLAIKSLQERFGREDMLVEVYVRDLLSLILENSQGKFTTNLSSLYVKLSTQLRALGTLGVTTDKCAAILYPMVESALPEEVFVAWERARHSCPEAAQTGEALLEKLMEFLKFEVEGSERYKLARQPFSSTSSSSKGEKAGNKTKPPATAATLVATENKPSGTWNGCVFCEGKHSSDKCCKAVSMSLEERREIVQKKRRCFACLKGGHSAKKCKEAIRCVSCGRKHFAIMCPEIQFKKPDNAAAESIKKKDNESVDLCNQLRSQDVILQSIPIEIQGKKKTKVVRALLDSGSQCSYVLKKTAQEVGLEKTGEKEVVHVLFGGTKSKPQQHSCYRIYLSGVDTTFSCNFEVQYSLSICGKIQQVPQGPWLTELKNKGINISEDVVSSEVEILIGSDVYAKLLTGNKMELSSGPVALETKFGWTVSGKLKNTPEEPADSTEAVISFHVRDASIQDLWNLDVIGIKDPLKDKSDSELNQAALDYFKQTVKRKEDGRYVTKLPFIEGHPPLPDYRFISEKKLISNKESLKKKGVLQPYHGVIVGWEDEGVIERVPQGPGHYLSHHGVLKPDSETTPVRPVFNGSFSTKGNPSLNQVLVVGPNMLEEIPAIVTRHRLGPVAVTSDIRKAFLQIELAEEDRDFVRFLWYKDNTFQEVQDYRHCRVVFGISSSPFLLAATLDYHLDNCQEKFKEAAAVLKKSFCLASFSSMEEALLFKDDAIKLLAEANMDLRCWEIGPSTEDKQVPVLGLTWNIKSPLKSQKS